MIADERITHMPVDLSLILKHFPELTLQQISQFEQLKDLYGYWNARINVISRRDIAHLYQRHVLHSLGIAKVIQFKPGTRILDVGTGGGFPGIPLSILFPTSDFYLMDSIGKKIKVVEAIRKELEINNITTLQSRAENVSGKYDFIIGRAVTQLPVFLNWIKNKFKKKSFNDLPNGILYLKGDDVDNSDGKIYHLKNYFEEEFFETKKLVYIQNHNKKI